MLVEGVPERGEHQDLLLARLRAWRSWSSRTAALAGAGKGPAPGGQVVPAGLAQRGRGRGRARPGERATLRNVSRLAGGGCPRPRRGPARSRSEYQLALRPRTARPAASRPGAAAAARSPRCAGAGSSPRRSASAAPPTFLGSVPGAAELAPCAARNCAAVPSSPGATRLTSSYRSCSRFSTGVAVSSSRCRERSSRTSLPGRAARRSGPGAPRPRRSGPTGRRPART